MGVILIDLICSQKCVNFCGEILNLNKHSSCRPLAKKYDFLPFFEFPILFEASSKSWHRPSQSIMYIPFQVNRFQKNISLIVQYKYSKSCSKEFFLKNPTKIWSSAQNHAVLHLLLNTVGFYISARQKTAWWKWFLPQLYQLRRDILEGPALKYFYMIHRVGRCRVEFICRFRN